MNAVTGGGVGLWDTTTHTLRGGEPLFVNEGVITSVAFSGDGQIVAAGYHGPAGPGSDHDAGVLLWDVRAHSRLGGAALTVNEGHVVSVAFSPDGKTIAAGYGARCAAATAEESCSGTWRHENAGLTSRSR